MSRALDLIHLAEAAIKFAQAVSDTSAHREMLREAYFDWRELNGKLGVSIERGDANWVLMMTATNEEFRLWQNAKCRKYRAEKKLLALAVEVEGL